MGMTEPEEPRTLPNLTIEKMVFTDVFAKSRTTCSAIPEAAQLVIQAGFMAKGGEVYVLDMGDPVKILDLAKLVIQLAGYRVKDSDSPNGDIPINFIGLRPGEKLYEELLIGADVAGTDHPKIMSAFEKLPSHKQLSAQLKKLEGAISTGDDQACRKVLATLVEGFPQ